MTDTSHLIQQHEELVAVLQELAGYPSDQDVMNNAKRISLTLSQLTRKFYFHLLIEERTLYPALLSSENESIRETCSKYAAEMDMIVKTFRKYRAAYSNTSKVYKYPTTFRCSTSRVAKTIIQRFEAEKLVLYPILEHFYSINSLLLDRESATARIVEINPEDN